jgi:hypothetical protein
MKSSEGHWTGIFTFGRLYLVRTNTHIYTEKGNFHLSQQYNGPRIGQDGDELDSSESIILNTEDT